MVCLDTRVVSFLVLGSCRGHLCTSAFLENGHTSSKAPCAAQQRLLGMAGGEVTQESAKTKRKELTGQIAVQRNKVQELVLATLSPLFFRKAALYHPTRRRRIPPPRRTGARHQVCPRSRADTDAQRQDAQYGHPIGSSASSAAGQPNHVLIQRAWDGRSYFLRLVPRRWVFFTVNGASPGDLGRTARFPRCWKQEGQFHAVRALWLGSWSQQR